MRKHISIYSIVYYNSSRTQQIHLLQVLFINKNKNSLEDQVFQFLVDLEVQASLAPQPTLQDPLDLVNPNRQVQQRFCSI